MRLPVASWGSTSSSPSQRSKGGRAGASMPRVRTCSPMASRGCCASGCPRRSRRPARSPTRLRWLAAPSMESGTPAERSTGTPKRSSSAAGSRRAGWSGPSTGS
eukprot:11165639-Lingulodinium_polyedra.AAC.1